LNSKEKGDSTWLGSSIDTRSGKIELVQANSRGGAGRNTTPYVVLSGAVALLSAGLLAYALTRAFAWDEGFHLLAAQLIKAGRRPYLDFFFPQSPLNAYWNAGWMSILGESWRTAHAIAALLSAGAVMLTADYVFSRFPVPGWRFACSLSAAALFGLNSLLFDFGTIGQAYGLCLFLIVAAFRLSVLAVDRGNLLWPAVAGLLASSAAESSLLTAPVAPVLLVWIFLCNRAGSRFFKCIAFVAGAILAWFPVLELLAKSPRVVLFNVFEFHLRYRSAAWEGAIQHDLGVMTAWIDSSQALLLGLLAIGGLVFAATSQEWDRRLRAEFYLCAWLALALGVQVSSPHPTFQRYYLLLVPFLSILASVGLYAAGSRLDKPDRPWPAFAVLTALLFLGLGKTLYDERDALLWQDMEAVAAKVDQVTPPKASLLADTHIYFLTRRRPPSGLEQPDSHKLNLPAAFAAALHVIPQGQLQREVQDGAFRSFETCDEDPNKLGLARLYRQSAEISTCSVYWDNLTAR
jgi:hypothetical protein